MADFMILLDLVSMSLIPSGELKVKIDILVALFPLLVSMSLIPSGELKEITNPFDRGEVVGVSMSLIPSGELKDGKPIPGQS